MLVYIKYCCVTVIAKSVLVFSGLTAEMLISYFSQVFVCYVNKSTTPFRLHHHTHLIHEPLLSRKQD